jgi:preprotein translocase subunit Sss1
VTTSVEGVALTTVGMILMIVGAIGFVVSLLYMFVWAQRGP